MPTSSPKSVVGVLSFCGIAVALMQTLVVPLIPELPRLLDTTPASASWVITATLLTAAVCNPVSGRLGDMYGKRRMMIISLVMMIAGSLICALSSSLPVVVAGRALQGCSIGVIPLGISIMRDVLPPARLGPSMALMSATLGAGAGVGLPLSAFVAERADWHTLFWMAAGTGVLSLILVLTVVRESPVRAPGRFDFPGAVGLIAGLLCLLLAVSKGADWGWGSPLTLGLFGGAVVILPLWAWLELRVRAPLVDLRTSARRPVLLTNLASLLVGFAMFAMSLVLPQLLQAPTSTGYGLGLSLLMTGLCMAPSGLVMMLLSPVSARVAARWGPKTALISGAAVLGVGYVVGVGLMAAPWQVVVTTTIVSSGLGLAYSAMPALIMSSVPPTETAAANGLNALMRAIGTASSSAVISVLLSQMTITTAAGPLPSFAGLRTALLLAAGAAFVGVLIAVFIPRGTRERRFERDEPLPVPVPAPVAPAPVDAPIGDPKAR
ncbi:MFS transporter [Spongiactinospora sp. TRM90649]|uniref:MFS transporter n=1 Tax=Spongiactinospora sp. TRM90649 TaxID=3031114 RepID=UPI0023F70F1B|nr:MFS transporter [Spongiactinospora sp. TRM90649]MDF5758720.1 MFS transporter [Spongiactinospora sp. TRM90649]